MMRRSSALLPDTVQVIAARGMVQLVGTPETIALDVQGVHRGVDGIERRDHGFAILTREEATKLRDLLTAMLTRRQKALAA
jgi:hypothetical protein